MAAIPDANLCLQGSYFHEDTEVGQCMEKAGVQLVNPMEGKKHRWVEKKKAIEREGERNKERERKREKK